MKRKHPSNQRLTSDRDRRKKYFVHGVVKRGTNETWLAFCRWTWRLVKVCVLLALLGGIGYGSTVGWKKFFWQNPDYALADITFATDGTLTRDQVRAVAKIKPGANIYSYKTGPIRDALLTLPQVESVEVARYLPNRIEITVKERKPTAWLAAAPGEKSAAPKPTHLLDANGVVFQPRVILNEVKSLPVIAGVQTEDLEPGKKIHKAEVLAALDLLKRTREAGSVKVTTVDVSKGCFIVATDQKRAQITFGLDDIAGQMDRLGAVRNEAALIGQEIATINLIPVRNIPVTFMQPEPMESDDASEPAAIPRAIPVRARTGTEAAPSPPARERSRPAGRRADPPRPPKSDGNGLLKPFRATA